MKRLFLYFALICTAMLCGSCVKPPSYPPAVDIDTVFLSHIDQYTAAAEILWEYGEPLVGEQEAGEHEWETSWSIHPDHPDIAIDSPLFPNYFTQEQWQIVSGAYRLAGSPVVTFFQSYWAKERPDLCTARCIDFYFITGDPNGKKAMVSYVYIKPTPGAAAQQEAVVNQMIRERSQLEDEWQQLDAVYWYKGKAWFR